jgi:RimJ/RimL family protein N-acetyltransferase
MHPNSNDIQLLGPWVWDQMGSTTYSSTGKSAMGLVDDDGIVRWAVVYDNYEQGGSVQMHIAITDPKYVTRRAISAVFEYPFYQLGVKKVLGFVNSENLKALSFDLRLGFEVEAVVNDVYERGDLYILSMTREKCRWLRGRGYGQESQRTAAA